MVRKTIIFGIIFYSSLWQVYDKRRYKMIKGGEAMGFTSAKMGELKHQLSEFRKIRKYLLAVEGLMPIDGHKVFWEEDKGWGIVSRSQWDKKLRDEIEQTEAIIGKKQGRITQHMLKTYEKLAGALMHLALVLGDKEPARIGDARDIILEKARRLGWLTEEDKTGKEKIVEGMEKRHKKRVGKPGKWKQGKYLKYLFEVVIGNKDIGKPRERRNGWKQESWQIPVDF
ncbi:MAG: hypothetical protein ABIH83_05005 [Candidatus Micrarchaeota archaeon]